jgi:uncharacterized protein (DUF362 family)
MSKQISRRDFIRAAGAAGLCAFAGIGGCFGGKRGAIKPRTLRPNSLEDKVAVVRGNDMRKMVEKAVAALGGIGAVVKKGDVVVVKPNIAWISRPELGGCTHPDVVATLVAMCLDAGARQVKVFDRPCRDPRFTYATSGIRDAAEAAGARVSFMPESGYVDLGIPRGKSLTSWPVYRDFLEADVVINAPVAKVHGTTGVTLAIKNLMGVAGGNRGTWHPGIHQKLADWLSALPCDLTVTDATRPMMRNGPDGSNPDDLEHADTIVAARDIVAADAWVTKAIFAQSFDRVRFIKIADEMGLGRLDTTGRVDELAA